MSSNSWRKIKNSIFPERTAFFAAGSTQYLKEKELQLAPYPLPHGSLQEVSESSEISSFRKPNAFDKVTVLAGSSVAFLIMLTLVSIWAVWGIVSGATDTWQIVFQNASSIQVYVADILLIRQQQNANRELMTRLAEINSRRLTFERLLTWINGCRTTSNLKKEPQQPTINGELLKSTGDMELDRDMDRFIGEHNSIFAPGQQISHISYAWAQVCQMVARVIGSLYIFFLYWVGIGVWIALGPSLRFSDTWQLYINTATALALTFTSVFLQNSQQREENKFTQYLQHTLTIDAKIEYRLRMLTADQKPNPLFTIAEPRRSRCERFNDIIADVMGSGLGVLISLAFVVVWVSIGPSMAFSDNWWLIIGSFTGLAGFVDGFVLRSLFLRGAVYVKEEFQNIMEADRLLLTQLNIPVFNRIVSRRSVTDSFSITISDTCGHRYAPLGAISVVVGLLIAATGMSWSITGQLICNTPTMIIEGFLLITLINAHIFANSERGAELNEMLRRRLILQRYIESIGRQDTETISGIKK